LTNIFRKLVKKELITVEEEVELAQRIKKGDQAALEKLTRANLRFVYLLQNSIRIKVLAYLT